MPRYENPGRPLHIHRVVVLAPPVVPLADIRTVWEPLEGAPLDSTVFRARMEDMLLRFARVGYPLATAHVEQVYASGDGVTVLLRVETGPRAVLKGVKLRGARRTRPAFVHTLLGWSPGDTLRAYDPEAIRRLLLRNGLFLRVGTPELQVTEAREVIIVVPVEEMPPGAFDVALGWQPGEGGSGLVGQGFLQVVNVLGGGRRAHMRFQRQPGQIRQMALGVEVPFLAGLPVGLGVQFEGYQRDSTYRTQDIVIQTTTHIRGYFHGEAWLRLRTAQPAVGGEALLEPARIRATGVGLRYSSVVFPANPRSGWEVVLQFEGRAKRTASGATLRQQMMQAHLRGFLPVASRAVLVPGLEGRYLRAPTYDVADLFRFGGATTLRGYAEDRFAGYLTARGTLEYRWLFGTRSYVMAFVDMGIVQAPEGELRRLPGYGVGMQMETAMGLTSILYALNPEEGFQGGKLHVALAIQL